MADHSSEYELTNPAPKKSFRNRLILIGVIVCAAGLIVGLLLGMGIWKNDGPPAGDGPCLGSDVPSKIVEDGEADIRGKLFAEIKAENIRANLE